MKKIPALSVVAASVVLALTGCAGGNALSSGSGTAGSAGDTVIIGSADFIESQLIASIYSQALQKAGVSVKEQFNIGAREVYMQALKDGSIDLIPEYSGALLSYLDTSSKASTSADVNTALEAALPSGVSMLDYSAAEDKDVLAVTKANADKYKLTKVSDLSSVASEFLLGGPPEWKTRENGVLGLKSVYGLTFKDFVSLDAGGTLTMTALTSGQVQVGDIFSTDPGLVANDLVALDDDKSLFAAENVVPIIASSKSSDTIKKTLNDISAKLTTADLIDLNTQAATGTDLAAIAKEWLAKVGLG